jgi:hypothetical protein
MAKVYEGLDIIFFTLQKIWVQPSVKANPNI